MNAGNVQELHRYSTVRRSSMPLVQWKMLSKRILQVFNIFETNRPAAIDKLWASQKAHREIVQKNRILCCLFFQY